ncbi:formyltetrahydrofolate deformylase [Halocatena salina]|uniref:Formyltetrahydrofolate deformylase n=1 Tax=Halocatena salina TaxID=2934340 RepID=A0A8U0A2N1_9EURY|nr:formyltetrahydrofolate deformylase [Halocatena salina]UPM42688.1 formyltetrahydrofolate deformylase [Halocatena salina]
MKAQEYTEITIVGTDDTGLIANITNLLFERGINIENLDQAVQDGLFRMTMHVDTTGMVCRPETLREDLHELGDDLGVSVQIRFPTESTAKRLGILVTKESHCLEAILEAKRDGELDAEIGVVIGNHSDLEHIATAYDVPFYDIGDESGTPDEERLLTLLSEYDVDLVVLARYMRILGPEVVFRYERQIINIHPSLLPAFPGAEPYRQAIDAGVRIAGVTAHYATTDLDQGPIITQRVFDVPDGATETDLQRRGQPLEADALLEAIKLHLSDSIYVHRGTTHLRNGVDNESVQLGTPEELHNVNPSGPIDDPDDRMEQNVEAEMG